MRNSLKVFVVLLAASYALSASGCAAPPKKRSEVVRKDRVIQDLTGENAALRREIDRLTNKNEKLEEKVMSLEGRIKADAAKKKSRQTIK